jgi:5,6-dimethylbenzimidazole synthase
MTTTPPDFDTNFRSSLHDLLLWRRDVRRFRTDGLPPETLTRLIDAARLAPSVGFSEPWRFVVVSSDARRDAMRGNFEHANKEALKGYKGERAQLYASLKLSGMEAAPLQIAVFADEETDQGHALGRASMPETLRYSTVTAIHTMWLVARAEGIGIGWVSILEPSEVPGILDTPAAWRFVAYLCIGFPEEESETPALEDARWGNRRLASDLVIER